MLRARLVAALTPSPPHEPGRRTWRWLAVAAVLAAAAVRLWIAYTFAGTTDLARWEHFADLAAEGRLRALYFRSPYPWSHPAPVLQLLNVVAWTRDHLGWPFHFAFKLWPVLADVASGVLLYGLARRREGEGRAGFLAACYLFSPLAIAVSAFHGTTDCLMVFWLLLALQQLPRRADWSALALGGALCTRYAAWLVVPLVLSLLPNRWRRLRYLALCLTPLALLSAPVLLQFPRRAVRNVFAYGGVSDSWGLGQVAALASAGALGDSAGAALALVLQPLLDQGRVLIVAVVLVVGAANAGWRRLDGPAALSLALAVFLALAPGFTVAHLVWPLAFFLLAERLWGAVYHLAAAVFLLLAYDSGRYDPRGLLDPTPQASAASLVAWAATAVIAGHLMLRLMRRAPGEGVSTPAA